MKKLLLLTALFLGCMNIQMNAFFIDVANKLDQKIDVDIKANRGCTDHGGPIAAHGRNDWDVGYLCRADITITLPDRTTHSIATGNNILIEVVISDGKYEARYRMASKNDWHTF